MEALLLVVVLATAGAAQVQQPAQIVVFVCEHGAAKSVVAAAQFNQMAAERGLPFRAISRGTAPDATVPSRVTEGLKRDGLRLPEGFTPTALSGTDMAQAIRIVSFDVILPTMQTVRDLCVGTVCRCSATVMTPQTAPSCRWWSR